jgi:hypothetical protein
MTNYKVTIETSISQRRHFINQKETADWLNIKNSSKKAIEARAKKFGYTVIYND